MSAGGWMMLLATVLTLGMLVFLVVSMVRSIANERIQGHSLWKDFGLGLGLMILFLISWVAHGITQWQMYTDEQRQHGQPVEAGDFLSEFGQATLENWQSEFLQLFSFVTLAALYIHRGSAESKESDEKLEASLRRIEEKLGTLPEDAPNGKEGDWQLPDPVATG